MTGDCCFLPLHRLQMLPDLVALPSGRACREMLPTWYLAQVLVSRSGQRPAMTMERCHTVEEGLCAGVRCSHPVFSNSWFLPVLSSYIPRVRRHHSRGGFPGTPLVLVQGPKSPGLHWSFCKDQGPRDSTGHSARTKVPGIPLVILQGPRSPGLHWSFCKDQGPRDSTGPSARTKVPGTPLVILQGPRSPRTPLVIVKGPRSPGAPVVILQGPRSPRTPLVIVQGPRSPRTPLVLLQGPRSPRIPLVILQGPTLSRTPLVIVQRPRSLGLHWSFCKDQLCTTPFPIGSSGLLGFPGLARPC
nr:uncharacterized protein LOC127488262 isoform X5 [Oryctolagus cuniculus]